MNDELSLLQKIENIMHERAWESHPRKKLFTYIGVIVVCGIVFIACAIGLYKQIQKSPDTVSARLKTVPSVLGTSTSEIYVDISGSVNKPGVYTLSKSTRLFRLIEKAGGLSGDADRAFIGRNYNLAVPLEDQQKIYIPSVFEVQSNLFLENQRIVSTKIDQLTETSSTSEDVQTLPGMVSLNYSPEETIMSLPGIGEVTAQRIMAARPYATVNDLVEKSIIKQALFDKIKDRIQL